MSADVVLKPGDSIQAQVDRNPPGTSFLLKSGLYRMQSIEPKSGDTFSGEKGAVLNGAVVVTPFHKEGPLWVASVQVQQIRSVGECGPHSPACNLPEDLFVDNVLVPRAMNVEGAGKGHWYLDYGQSKLYVGDNPDGHEVEMSLARTAFSGDVSNVTIRGLTIEKYASPTGAGAVHGSEFQRGGKKSVNWIVQDNEIRWNHDVGVWLGHGMHLLHNNLHHNGHMGAGGSGRNILVENNEIAYNNYAGYDYHWGAGGAKFVLCANLEVRNNYAHHNEGPGLWSDIDNDNVVYEKNRTSSNKVAGIFFEISFGAVIHDNIIDNDGENPGGPRNGAGILVNTSSDADIYGNQITNCATGILAIQTDRGVSDWTKRTYVLKNLNVHDNVITQKSGIAAGIDASPGFMPAAFTDWNNRFQNNTYRFAELTGMHFEWMRSPRSIEEWKSFHNDSNGRFQKL
jgi:hypothetical protein